MRRGPKMRGRGFNDWEGPRCPMRLRLGAGVWESFAPCLARDSSTNTRSGHDGELCCRVRPILTRRHASGHPAPPPDRAVASRVVRQAPASSSAGVAHATRRSRSTRRMPRCASAGGLRFLTWCELAVKTSRCRDGLHPSASTAGGRFPFDGSCRIKSIGMSHRPTVFVHPTISASSSMPATAAGIVFCSTAVPK